MSEINMTWTIYSDEKSTYKNRFFMFSAMRAEGTKLLLKWAFSFQSSTLFLRPDGSHLKNWLRECSVLLTTTRAICAIASSFASDRLGVGRSIILDAV